MENTYSIPTIEQIKAIYEEIVPLISALNTKEEIIAFSKKHKVTMEINYDSLDYFDAERDTITCIRCESWSDLDYIYVYKDGSEPKFDVWCDMIDDDFIDSTTIPNLETEYKYGIKWLWSKSKDTPENQKEIIKVLRSQGVEYNDMIEEYEFDSSIVEQYEAEYDKMEYGDVKLLQNQAELSKISNLQERKGKINLGYYRMYYRNGYDGVWFENAGKMTQCEKEVLSQVIDTVKELAPEGMTPYFQEHLNDVATASPNGRYYYFETSTNFNFLVEFAPEYGNDDYPVRIYVYRDL